MAASTPTAYFASAVIAVLGMFLNESADTYWASGLGLSPADLLTPSLIIGVGSVAAASHLPTPFKLGLLWSGTIAILLNLKRFAVVQREYFGLTVIGVMLITAMIYAQHTKSAGYFAEHYGYGF